jgi:hypothetical protein
MDRDRIPFIKPKANGRFKLAARGGLLCDSQEIGSRFWDAHWLSCWIIVFASLLLQAVSAEAWSV